MKLASFDNFLIQEQAQSHREAADLGLVHVGQGRYKDPRTNKITHQSTENGLEPIIKEPEMGPGQANNPDALKAKQMMGAPAGAQNLPGSGIAGAPEPGTEQHPRGGNWGPGPNGDNCVTGQPAPTDISFDAFVKKTNFHKWTAGKDGSNFKNIKMDDLVDDPIAKRESKKYSFDTFLSEGPVVASEKGNPTPGGAGGPGLSPGEKAKQMGLTSNGNGTYSDSQGQTVAMTVNGELVFFDQNSGGAVTDSGGGMDMVNAKPQWKDPATGQMMMPPAKPESPEEIAAVPTPTPAQKPAGYDRFMQQKKEDAQKQMEMQDEVDGKNQELDQKYATSPISRAFKARMDGMINDGMQSEDPDERAVAMNMMDIMDENSDAHIEAIESLPATLKPDATNHLARMVEREAMIRNLETQDPVSQEKSQEKTEITSNSIEDVNDEPEEIEQEPDAPQENPEIQQVKDEQAKDIESYEKNFNNTINTYLDTLGPRQKKDIQEYTDQVREQIKNIPSASDRASVTQAMAHAYTYTGRVNSGTGKNDLGFVDIQTLTANRDRLMEGYGDGSAEKVEKFVRSARSTKVNDEFFESSFASLPPKLRKAMGKKGLVTTNAFTDENTPHKDVHFLGYDEEGNDVRGELKGKENEEMRARLMWRIYLEQNGMDAYTGLPLDPEAMDLEHVVGFKNNTNGEPGKAEFEARENERNMVMVASNVNQKKVDMSMEEFFESQVDPFKDNTEAQFGGVKNVKNKANEVKTQNAERCKILCGGKKGKTKYKELNEDVSYDALNGYFDTDDKTYDDIRKEFREVASSKKEASQAAGLKANMGGRMMKTIGLTRTTRDKSGRRNTELPEQIFRGYLLSLSLAPPEQREDYYKGWETAIATANESRDQKDVAKVLKELNLIHPDVLNDNKRGRPGYVYSEDYDWNEGICLSESVKSFSGFLKRCM